MALKSMGNRYTDRSTKSEIKLSEFDTGQFGLWVRPYVFRYLFLKQNPSYVLICTFSLLFASPKSYFVNHSCLRRFPLPGPAWCSTFWFWSYHRL